MRPYHLILAALFMLGLAACDNPPAEEQTGELPQQQEGQTVPDPIQPQGSQPQTGVQQ